MATTGYVRGSLVGIYIGGVLVAYGMSAKHHGERPMIDVSNKDSNQNTEIIPGDGKKYTTNFSGKMRFDAGYGLSDVIDAFDNGTLIVLKMSTEVSGDMYLQVSGYVGDYDWEADYGDSAVFSFTHNGTGSLTKSTVL